MIKYTQVSKSHYLNNDTLHITTASKLKAPRVIFKPQFLGDIAASERLVTGAFFVNGKLEDVVSRTEETNSIRLRNLRVTERGTSHIVSFYDNRTKKKYEVILDISHLWLKEDKYLTYDFSMSYNGVATHREGLPFYGGHRIKDLAHRFASSDIKTLIPMNYGLIQSKYEVAYKGNKLDGTCYCFLFGIWGILLRDDLSIDALVLIRGQKGTLITIEHFLWTSSPYITKFILMMKK